MRKRLENSSPQASYFSAFLDRIFSSPTITSTPNTHTRTHKNWKGAIRKELDVTGYAFGSKLYCCCRGQAVVQLVEALRYKPEDRRFDSRWRHWNFSLT
jgi:hypothetical protein